MSNEKPPNHPEDPSLPASTAAQKARAMLADPELRDALADLRAATPAGEPLFGFKIKRRDARAEVPIAESMPVEDGTVIVADKEAAAAYAAAAPAIRVSPRMPTGKVRIRGDAAAEQRRRKTQPSLARGGGGGTEHPPAAPPAERDEFPVPAVLDRAVPPSSVLSADGLTGREAHAPRSRAARIALASVFAFAAIGVIALVLGAPQESRDDNTLAPQVVPSGTASVASATSVERTSSDPAVTASVASAPTVSGAPSTSAVATGAPNAPSASAPAPSSVPSSTPPRSSAAPSSPVAPPAPEPSVSVVAAPAASPAPTNTGEPITTPDVAPTAKASAAPTTSPETKPTVGRLSGSND